MRFLIDANLPRSTVAHLVGLGHAAEHVRDLGLGDATDERIAEQARISGSALVTRDLDFADVRRYPPAGYNGIVVVRLPDDAVMADILRVLERFLSNAKFVAGLAGRLAIVEPDRVRFRPPLA